MEKITITDYYHSLTFKDKKTFRVKVCDACGLEYFSLSRRLRERSFNKLEIEAIKKVINDKRYEFTN